MRSGRNELFFPIALLLSLLLHAGGVAGLVMLQAANAAPRFKHAGFEAEPPESREEEQPEVELGIDADTPSSMTWIGYEQYEEHLAQLSDVEQAAFRTDPSAGAAGVAASEPTPEVATDSDTVPTEVAASTDVPLEPKGETTTTAERAVSVDDSAPEFESTDPPAGQPAPPVLAPTETSDRLQDFPTLPLVERMLQARIVRDVAPDATPVEDSSPQPVDQSPDPAPPPSTDPGDAEPAVKGTPDATETERVPDAPAEARDQTEAKENKPTPKPRPAADSAPGAPSDAPPDLGDDSDRESDATSIIDVPPENWRKGRPLASPGIEIITRRPVFTTLTRLTSAPRNPIVELHFDRRGIPKTVRLLLSSGDSRIDGPVTDSLYRWRAKGKKIDELRRGETVVIRIRMLLIG